MRISIDIYGGPCERQTKKKNTKDYTCACTKVALRDEVFLGDSSVSVRDDKKNEISSRGETKCNRLLI